VTFGETMALFRAREVGSLRHAADVVLGIGGAESNVAIGLSRLGVDVGWLGRVGDDSLGERVLREIRAEGIEVRGILDHEARTGLMVKERPAPASSAVHYYRGGSAGSRLEPDDIPPGWIEEAAVLHVTGITALLSESARACLMAAIARGRAAGVLISFDVNYRSALAPPEVAGPLLRAVADEADLVFGGADELRLLRPGAADPVQELRDGGVGEVVLKRGAHGASVFHSGRTEHIDGLRVDVVDTVGAGDAFVAGYLSGLIEALDVAARLERANICGALACTVPGDWEAAPMRREVARFGRQDVDPVAR
jgi:2-dehydro-3-deoxygluconokinase